VGNVTPPARTAVYKPGDKVVGRFVISHRLGTGNSGVVYLAYDTLMDRNVAIKFVTRELDEKTLASYRREINLGRKVSSPFVCQVHDSGFDEKGNPFVSMDYVTGTNIKEELCRVKRFVPEKVLEYAIELCAGLQAIHETRVDEHTVGIVHCDLKPANIMLDDEGHAKITDLGLAIAVGAPEQVVGTLEYAAPEQWESDPVKPPLHSVDIYSFGLILYEMLTGDRCLILPALEGMDVLEVHAAARLRVSQKSSEIGHSFERIISRCLHEDPRSRPTANQLRGLLDACESSSAI
jgi:serine/threonine protein kinase